METLKVIKIGGNLIDNPQALIHFTKQFSKMEGHKILVHGGGKLATNLAKKMDCEVKLMDGRRVTDKETLDITTMVYGGKINKTIIAQLQSHCCNAIGFTGADGNTIIAKKRPVGDIDFGYVGDIQSVNTKVLHLLLQNNVTPVFSAITHNGKGQLFNTNADTMASAIAIGFSKVYRVELYYCFEKMGVLRTIENANSVIEQINSSTYKTLLDTGIISEGMLPKLENAFHAIENEVKKVCIGAPEMLFNPKSKFTTIKPQ